MNPRGATVILAAFAFVGCQCGASPAGAGSDEADDSLDDDVDAAALDDAAIDIEDSAVDAGSEAVDAGSDVGDAASVSEDSGISSDDGGTDSGSPDTSISGCADGTREGFVDVSVFPAIAACAGSWVGHITNAEVVCVPSWHVCLGTESALEVRTYAESTAFAGCFAFDAINDNFTCSPDCSEHIDVIDSEENVDAAGLGENCPYSFEGDAISCTASGRIDASENDGHGCNYYDGLTGAVCCRDSD